MKLMGHAFCTCSLFDPLHITGIQTALLGSTSTCFYTQIPPLAQDSNPNKENTTRGICISRLKGALRWGFVSWRDVFAGARMEDILKVH
jgi:hypothetical protein